MQGGISYKYRHFFDYPILITIFFDWSPLQDIDRTKRMSTSQKRSYPTHQRLTYSPYLMGMLEVVAHHQTHTNILFHITLIHCTGRCSKFLSNFYGDYLAKDPLFESNLAFALKRSFLTANEQFLKQVKILCILI